MSLPAQLELRFYSFSAVHVAQAMTLLKWIWQDWMSLPSGKVVYTDYSNKLQKARIDQ